MNCDHAHQEIKQILEQDVKPSQQLQEHIETCSQCRSHWQMQALEQWISRFIDAPVQSVSPLAETLWVDFRAS